MGKRICQFGIEHGRCRCMCPDKEIPCDVPDQHQPKAELSEHEKLTRALDAAQDEIEARILASERDRELIRQLGVVVDHMAPAAYRAIMAGGGVV